MNIWQRIPDSSLYTNLLTFNTGYNKINIQQIARYRSINSYEVYNVDN